MMTVFGWNIRLVDFASLAIAVFVSIGIVQFLDYRRQSAPLDEWVEVKRISVPDFSLDEDPLILFDVEVKQPFFAQRTVTLRDLSAKTGEMGPFDTCSSRTRRSYEPGEDGLPVNSVPLSTIVGGRRCQITNGQYALEVTWEVQRDGYAPRMLTHVSNIFNILPPGAQQYITPEQVEKLK